MKATAIPAHEASFDNTGVDSAGNKFILKESDFPIKDSAETLKITICNRKDGFKDYYYPQATAKKKIVLHYTMGYLKGDIATLTKSHVSVPFVIGRNGKIYNLFWSKYWSYHLGKGTAGGNMLMSKESIGIEISNIGPLKRMGDNLVSTYNDDFYCTFADTQYYVKLPSVYRKYDYYATFTDAQYEAVIKLIRFLCANYNIPKTFIDESIRYEILSPAAFTAFKGITSHVNCRPDKTDIGAAFDWHRVIDAVNRPDSDFSSSRNNEMPVDQRKKREAYQGRVLNARADTIDFRDKMYSPTLIEVPTKIGLDSYSKLKVPILDQGTEGACTGFGLATVVHYLLLMRRVVPSDAKVSPRMLYEMAKKYDEWEGVDYIGSSARGAMKGWHKHGVCEDDKWPYCSETNRDKDLNASRAENAAKYPLGAYYRVNHKDLVDIHTAIAEVGILYATARVHNGWYHVDKTGEIPFDGSNVVGGHAFAIVGYDEKGFWIQNSWGKKWGKNGFAQISYDDWLSNATDVWVARLGAPISIRSANSIARSYSVAVSTSDGLAYKDLRPHVISLGNNGKLKVSGTYGNYENDVKRIIECCIPDLTKGWKKKRIMLYAHGGLVHEASVLQRLADYRQPLLKKEIYPLFFVWNSDLGSTIKNMLSDAFNKKKPEERISSVFDFMLDRIDDALEPLVRLPGKAAWDEMKENALGSTHPDGGAMLALKYLNEYCGDFSIHLVGHSAGSIFLAPFVDILTKVQGKHISSCTLWAPACTMQLFEKSYLPAILDKSIKCFTLFTLTDQAEQDDNCFYIYNKSLLFLASNSFEVIARGTEILGMAKYIDQHTILQQLLKKPAKVNWIQSPNTLSVPDKSEARKHGDFDNDKACFESTVARIIQCDPDLTGLAKSAGSAGSARSRGSKGPDDPGMQMGDAMLSTGPNPVDGGQAGTEGGLVHHDEQEKPPVGASPTDPQILMRPTREDFKNKRDGLNQRFTNNNNN